MVAFLSQTAMTRFDFLDVMYERWTDWLNEMFYNRSAGIFLGLASAIYFVAMSDHPLLKSFILQLPSFIRERRGKERTVVNILTDIRSFHGVPSLVRSIECAILILQMARLENAQLVGGQEIDEFFELLNEVAINSGRISRQGFGSLKVLCIEGLSGSGKSTVVDGLVKRAGAILVGPMPPAKLKKVTDLFSGSPEPVLTALRFALNYCTAYRIISDVAAAAPTAGKSSDNRLVVVNKFYHSVCARTVCTNVKNDVDLKSLPASAFEWPLDLPTPSLVSYYLDIGLEKYLLFCPLLWFLCCVTLQEFKLNLDFFNLLPFFYFFDEINNY